MNVQTENGYFKVANQIQNKLCGFRIPGEAAMIFNTVIRKTWGYGKSEDTISLSQFVSATGLKKPNVVRALSKLITHNIIIKTDNNQGCKYKIQKDVDKWVSFTPLSNAITPIIKSDNGQPQKTQPQTLSKAIHTIDKKTILQKTRIDKSIGDESPKREVFGNPDIDWILAEFKKTTGKIPADKQPRRVAHNILQLTGTFIKFNGELFQELRGGDLTKRYAIEKFFINLKQKKYVDEMEKLETAKLKYKVYLDGVADQLKLEKKQKEGNYV